MQTADWSTVEVFGNRGMAEVAGTALQSAEIPSRIVPDDHGRTGGPSLMYSGVELQVPSELVQTASELLHRGVDIPSKKPAPEPADMKMAMKLAAIAIVLVVLIGLASRMW